MKFLYPKFCVAFLLLFFALKAKAVNDTLNIGQVFNWQVGDTFMYRSFTMVIFTFPDTVSIYPLKGFTVLGKTNNADSLAYEIKMLPEDTISYVYLRSIDSSITSFQPEGSFFEKFRWRLCTCDTNSFCNYHTDIDPTLNYATSLHTSIDNATGNSCLSLIEENIGLKNIQDWYGGDPDQGIPPIGQYSNLVYYRSGNTIWIDSSLYFFTEIAELFSSNSFHLFPNPATNEINITSTNESGSTFDISLFDITGKCLRTIKKIYVNNLSLNINDLTQGFYWLRFTSDKGFSASKSFVIAR